MASSLLPIITTSNLVMTRSFRPTAVSTSRFRSYATNLPTTNDFYNQLWLRSLLPTFSSIGFRMAMYPNSRSLKLETLDENLCVSLETEDDDEDCLPLLIQGKTVCNDIIMIKEEMKENMLNKDDVMANIGANIIASFRGITTKRSWKYYDMFFNRSILANELCPIIAMMSPIINSFSIYKVEIYKDKEYAETLDIEMCMPGKVKMKLTTQGLRVSFKMYGLNRRDEVMKREDVKTYFDYDTFFIEGKTERYDNIRRETTKRHYITGIHLPEGIHKRHNMIKRQMKGNGFYAIIACRVNKEELREIKHQLKPNTWLYT